MLPPVLDTICVKPLVVWVNWDCLDFISTRSASILVTCSVIVDCIELLFCSTILPITVLVSDLL